MPCIGAKVPIDLAGCRCPQEGARSHLRGLESGAERTLCEGKSLKCKDKGSGFSSDRLLESTRMPKLWNRVKSGDVYGFGLRLGSSALQGLDCLCYCARTIKFDFVVSLGGSYEKAGSDNLLCNGREQRNGTGGWCIYWYRNGGCRR